MADEDDFEPRLGRMRSGGGKRARRYLGRVLAAANLARGGAFAGQRSRTYSGSRTGRGAGVGRLLASRLAGHRRVIVKTSIVKLAGKGAAGAVAHLRYLQRDGTTRDGEPGVLYGRDSDAVDGRAFTARGGADRHQFRFIVSPEDGDQYEDLRPLTRRLMARVEEDLGTTLDWVAVDHHNTGHPHTHIVVRGVDERGQDLVIARDYLTRGLRERAAELVDLDLGSPSPHEIAARLRREVDQERLTSIDRALLRDSGATREVAASHADPVMQSMRAGRLAKLSRMGLADDRGGGRYRLATGLADTLQRMGERGDIVRTMQRAYGDGAIALPPADHAIFDPRRDGVLVGRVVMRGLADEQADRHFLIVDALDGRAHYVAIGRGQDVEMLAPEAIVEVRGRETSVRPADRAIAAIAGEHAGQYSVEHHLRADANASEDFADAHIRRLEAARRAGLGVIRSASATWTIPADYLEQVEAWERRNLARQPVAITLLSARPVERLVDVDAVTWLDRRRDDPAASLVRDAGFGAEVRRAEIARRAWLIEQELAEQSGDKLVLRRGALATLQRRELMNAAAGVATETGKTYAAAQSGDHLEGTYRGRLDLIGGRFAIVERAHDFTLVPWRPALEQAVGKTVSGLIRDGQVSWTIGRGRQGPTIS